MKSAKWAWLTLLLAGTVLAGQVYKWKDADGRIHYSDTPPPAGGKVTQMPMHASEQPVSAIAHGHWRDAVPRLRSGDLCAHGAGGGSALARVPDLAAILWRAIADLYRGEPDARWGGQTVLGLARQVA